MGITCIIVSAGKGKRMHIGIDKPYLRLLGRPIFIYSLSTLSAISSIEAIILVVERDKIEVARSLVQGYNLSDKVKKIIPGGKTRRESVIAGLASIDGQPEFIMIHDAARPLVRRGDIENLIRTVQGHSAAVLGVEEVSSLKIIDDDGFIKKNLDRRNIRNIQTPQVFRYSIIKEAYTRFPERPSLTDDAGFVEGLGIKIKVVEGSYSNIKITTQTDLVLAEALLKEIV